MLGRKAHAISPTTALNYGITGDALVELGRYPAAFEAFDTMATLRPSLSSYARVSHGLELLGRVPEAIETMKLAVQAAQGQGEPEAWTRFQLGKLYWSIGRVAAAERQDRAALQSLSRLPLRARRARAGSRRRRATTAPRSRSSSRPSTGSRCRSTWRSSATSTARTASGEAREQYALIGVIERLLVANGVKTDLETALFDVDHGIRLPRTRSRSPGRPAPSGPRSTATTCSRGRSTATAAAREALGHSKQALRLGTRDALKLFHRGMIERCLGDRDASRSTLRAGAGAQPALLDPLGPRREKGTPVKRLLVLVGLLGILGAAMLPGAASAHPLGNFTVNHFAAVELAGNGVYVRYALDLAEIPTFQEGAEVRTARLRGDPRPQPRSPRRRQAGAADRPLAPHLGAAGCRRAEDDALRRGLPRARRRARS